MNIDRISQTQPVNTSDVRQNAQTRSEHTTAPGTGKENGTRVRLSQRTQRYNTDDSHDVNYPRLAEIQAKIDAGDLPLDSDKIAGSLVNDLFQLS
ncbi:Anti-sigma-28 factor [Enterobacter sp. DC4]|uniref:flagellar biosynthesis anti-sigma factor FlgM n=1 Tax=Enterobacter sp. DC4 TaxID=1395580 RepID=UPI0003ED1241|nr:flagellar biosynthesis anti-sigma factor FlgM [Enterobacter sp. DC4]EWG67280.1 Anti-sigma-28 factor [Enterobacter sp. DC4]